jgi:hypothetical protein
MYHRRSARTVSVGGDEFVCAQAMTRASEKEAPVDASASVMFPAGGGGRLPLDVKRVSVFPAIDDCYPIPQRIARSSSPCRHKLLGTAALVLALGPCANAQQTQDSRQASSPLLLIVHGRNEGTEDPGALFKRWSLALDTGLVAAGLTAGIIPHEDRRFAYYGDVFRTGYVHPSCEQLRYATQSRGSDVPRPENAKNGLLRLARAFTKFMPSSWQYSLVMPFTQDTKQYIEDGKPSCSVRNILYGALDSADRAQRSVVVLAHSQGALLTYEYEANNAGWGIPLAGFVSVGSQFGFDNLVKRFGAKDRRGRRGYVTPTGLGLTWYNLYDDHDAVAFRMADRFDSTEVTSVMREIRVRNSERFRHDAVGYLRNPVVALATAHAWCRAPNRQAAECENVDRLVAAGGLAEAGRRMPDGWSFLAAPLAVVPLAAYVLPAQRIVR